MPARKRGRDEMEAEEPVQEPTTLQKLRNMWQFANLAQYINLFGDAIKIDKDFDIEDLETECLMPQPSEKLAQIGLALLKHVSSHKGLTLDIFDEYTRRQFVAKAPDRNPFGIDEEPNKFNDFDIFTKIRVLQQLSLWTLNNPNSIRERMNATDSEQTQWRMEPTGWDSQDRALFILDDNRMYRRTDPPPPPPPPKAKSKPKPKKSRSTRTSKRRKVSTPEPEEPEEEDMTMVEEPEEAENDGLGGMKWECLCITLEDYQEYLSSIRKSRDPNEKILYKRIEEDVLPVIGKMAEEEARKQARKMKELETMQKLALAKRSSRISQRLEKQKEAEAEEAAERKRQAELTMAQAEQEKQKRIEEAHESRRMTREQRLREREAAKILKEEELRKLKEDEEKLNNNNARLSERHLKAMLKRRKEELERLNEEEDWFFDCEKCGMHGSKLDDGSGQVCCDKCNVWQHLKCHNIPEDQADKVDFICSSCKRKEEEAKQPKLPPLKLRLTSTSPSSREGKKASGHAPGSAPKQTAQPEQPRPRFEPAQTPMHHSSPTRPPPQSIMDGPSLSPRGQALGPPGIHRSEAAYGSPFINRINGSSPPRPYSSGLYNSNVPVANMANGLPASSPPRYQAPSSPSNNFSLSHSAQRNGSPFGVPNPFRTTQPPYSNSFGRPASASGLGNSFGSPVKHSPGPSPRPTNGVPNAYNFTKSPHSSFPPSSHQRPSFSPTKNSSPPPHPPLQMSSPATASVRIVPSPSQMPAQVLPDPIPAPSKHDGARPVSSHSLSETPVLPPVQSFSPSTGPQILSPPKKKQSPAPERTIGVIPFNRNAG